MQTGAWPPQRSGMCVERVQEFTQKAQLRAQGSAWCGLLLLSHSGSPSCMCSLVSSMQMDRVCVACQVQVWGFSIVVVVYFFETRSQAHLKLEIFLFQLPEC
jgi:hypothetical protein